MLATAPASRRRPRRPIALWRQYLDEIERRHQNGDISDADYHLLRSSREARLALMDKTVGEEHTFSAGTIDEVLAHAREAIQAEERARTDEQRARTEEERELRLAAEESARTEHKRRERVEQVHHDRVDRRARMLGRSVSGGLAALIALAVIIGCIATIPGMPIVEIKGTAWRVLIWVCVAAFVVLTVWALVVKGVTVRDLRKGIASAVEERWRAHGHRKLDALHAEAEPAQPDA
jgi:hypothetical protein